MDAAQILAEHLEAVCYADLPKNAVDATKRSVLDTLGVILGASGTVPELKELTNLVKEAGGKEESTIIGFGGRVPAWMAAFVNGSMAHALDYDDLCPGATHLGSSTIPAAFAIAERVGGLNGKELVTAIAAGQDILSRLTLSMPKGRSLWHVTSVLGVFSATAVSCKILALDRGQMVDAFGIALSQAAGTMELRWGIGSELGGMYPGFAGKNGVLSALMAQRGISGVKNSLEGRAGLFNTYFQGEYDRHILLDGLGKEFRGADLGFKAWPACAGTNTAIDATLALVKEHDIRPEDVGDVVVHVGRRSLNMCEPLDVRHRPTTTLDAKYSIPFAIGIAIVRRSVGILDFTAEGRDNRAVLELAQRVRPRHDPDMDSGRDYPALVQIHSKDGKTYQRRSDHPHGHPDHPLSQAAIHDKFRDCASHAIRSFDGDGVETVIRLTNELEQIEDVGQIIQLVG